MFDNIYRAAFENLNISLRPAFNDVALYQAQRFPAFIDKSNRSSAAAPRLQPQITCSGKHIQHTCANNFSANNIKQNSLTLSAVGRTSIFFGTVNFRPRAFPVIIRIQKTPYL